MDEERWEEADGPITVQDVYEALVAVRNLLDLPWLAAAFRADVAEHRAGEMALRRVLNALIRALPAEEGKAHWLQYGYWPRRFGV